MKVHAEFEGGNVEGVEVVAPDRVRVRARADGSPHPLWFYFCLEDATAPLVRVDLMNADDCLGPREGWSLARPVFSADTVHWQRVARTNYVRATDHNGYFHFLTPIVGRRTYVAYCYPYSTHDLARLLQALAPHPHVEVATLADSEEGRPVPHVRIGTAAPRHGVWVVARQHAGETPASFVAEGLLEWAAGDDPAAAEMRAETALHVLPMVDVDGVFHGRYGKDGGPVDFNRDWGETPTHPPIAVLVRETAAWAVSHPYDLFIDLHASHHGETSCYVFADDTREDAGCSTPERHFLELLASASPSEVGFRPDDIRFRSPPPGSARGQQACAHRAVGLCIEISYHFARSGALLTPELYREFGASIGRAIHLWLATR